MAFANDSISSFLDGVASENVTPSGGAVAALTGAMAASLCEMVCIHTLGHENDDVAAELADINETLRSHRNRLLELADEDKTAVEAFQSTLGSAETQAESGTESQRERAEASKRTTEPPIETAEICLDILEHAVVLTESGTQNAVADSLTGVFLARAALDACTWTARANLELIDDDAFVSAGYERIADIERAGKTAFDRAKTAGTERYQRQ